MLAADLARERDDLLAERARIDDRLSEIAAMSPAPCVIPLCRAAGIWGISYQAGWKRAQRLASVGLAEKLYPGGWRVSPDALTR